MGYDLYRIKLVYSVVRTVAIPMLKSFLQGFDIQFWRGGRCRQVAVVERWPLWRCGHCGEVVVVERWSLWRVVVERW